MSRIRGMLAVTAIGMGIMVAAPVEAQGNGRGRQAERPAAEADWGVFLPGAGDRSPSARGNGSGKVPPGWCQGVGNPHNTVENCGYSAGNPSRDAGRTGRNSSYEEAHARFHRELDERYSRLAAQRPLDIRYQAELQARKRAEHDAWHRQMGVAH